jgi:hypothetical protein
VRPLYPECREIESFVKKKIDEVFYEDKIVAKGGRKKMIGFVFNL